MKAPIRPRRPTAAVLWAALTACALLTACTGTATIEQTSGAADAGQSEAVSAPDSASEDNDSGDAGQSEDAAAGSGTGDATDADGTATGGDDTQPAGDESTGDETQPADDDASAVGNGTSTVVVLDPGAEPRTELRLVIAPSCGEIMTFTQVQEISQSLDGQPSPSTGPIGNVMEMATSATPNGDNYDVRAEILSAMAAPDTPPQIAAGINASLADLVGLTTVSTMTDRAEQVPGSTRIEGGEALGPLQETVEMLSQQQAPLPVEAVGVGARWETTSTLEVQGLQVDTTSISEVVSIEGTIVELQVTGTQFVELGSMMDLPGLRGEVTEWVAETSGTTVIDLATISPIRSTIVTDAVQGIRFDDGLNSGQLDQTIRSEVTIVGEPDDGCTGSSAEV